MVAPMHTTSPVATSELVSELADLVEDRQRPSLDHRHGNSFRVNELTVADCPDLPNFINFTEQLALPTLPKQATYAKARMRQWRLILANLCQATAVNSWVGIGGDKNEYARGTYLHGLGLQYASTKLILACLVDAGLLDKQQGKRYQNHPITNQYYPTKALQRILVGCSLFTENPMSFDRPLLSINDPDRAFNGFKWPDDHDDRILMEEINDFARTQSWACKASIRQVFKHNPFQGGRLVTPFQNLHNRTYMIRKKTLINGNRICEVDYNANHLRLFLAFNKTDVVGGADAYQVIVHESGLTRDIVKNCINIALNTGKEKVARQAAAYQGIDSVKFTKFITAFSAVYPHLDIFANQALSAMQLEGLILRDVLHKGASEGILALPVHDAVAVEEVHEKWAVDAMTETWERWVSRWNKKAKASVKIS